MSTVPKQLTPEAQELVYGYLYELVLALNGSTCILVHNAEILHEYGLLKIRRPKQNGANPVSRGRFVQVAPTALLLRHRAYVEALFGLKYGAV